MGVNGYFWRKHGWFWSFEMCGLTEEEKEKPTNIKHGGILADEMGMGKTIEVRERDLCPPSSLVSGLIPHVRLQVLGLISKSVKDSRKAKQCTLLLVPSRLLEQ